MILAPLTIAATLISAAVPALAVEFCSGTVRVTCVVDGDTFWLQGEKIRLMDIDAPEVGGACEAERTLSTRAAGRLADLLTAGPISIERHGQDRYKRTVAVVYVASEKVGDILISEGLARRWSGKRERWCEVK